MNVMVDDVTTALWQYQGRTYDFDYPAMQTAIARVNKGATLLDEAKPGWDEEIIPKQLDMSSGEFCIIGQAYGNYDEHIGIPFGMNLFEGEEETYDLAADLAEEHGFLSPRGSKVPYELLDRAWVYMLTARRAVENAVTLELPAPLPMNKVVVLLKEKSLFGDESTWTAKDDRYDAN